LFDVGDGGGKSGVITGDGFVQIPRPAKQPDTTAPNKSFLATLTTLAAEED
jgi:hypothetical protein